MYTGKVVFDMTRLVGLVLASLAYHKEAITGNQLQTIYASDKKVVGDRYLLPCIAAVTYTQAKVSCLHQKSRIFTVEKDMDLRTILTDLEMDSVWVGIYKSATMDSFIDDYDMPPVSRLVNDTISMTDLTLLGWGDDKAVVVKKTTDKLSYVAVPQTEHHRCICMQNVPYPKTASDILALKNIQENLAHEIVALTDTVKISFSKIERSLLQLPKLDAPQNGKELSTVSVQSELERKIGDLAALSNRTSFLFKNIKSFAEVAEVITIQRKFVQLIRYVERFSRDILEEPLLLIDKQDLTNMDSGSVISLVTDLTCTNFNKIQ